MGFVIYLLIGGIAGWLAGLFMKGKGFGVLRNVIIGIIGSFIGSLTFNLLGLSSTGFIGSVVMATVGAVVLIYVVKLIRTS